jgi:hypothetical protein
MDKTKKKECKESLGVVRQELTQEIINLREVFCDILDRYQSNLEAEMIACQNSLASADADEVPAAAMDCKQIKALLAETQGMKLKPRKGRLKDLHRIQNVVELLYSRLVEFS